MNKVLPFVKYRYLMITLTLLSILGTWAYTFVQGGFKFGIDFQPGISLTVKLSDQVSAESLAPAKLTELLGSGTYKFSVQTLGEASARTFVLRASASGADENKQQLMEAEAVKALGTGLGSGNVSVLKSDYIGPSMSAELVIQTLGVTLGAMVLIFVYILFRFRLAYAIGAILSLIHDVLFVLGFLGLMGIEISSAVIASLLTLIGYSLNDTIVVFDRIRENVKLKKDNPVGDILDGSITQSLSRTVITSGTTLFSVLALYLFTTGPVQDFALALLVGIMVGTYSSIYIASPVLMLFKGGKDLVAGEK